MISSVISRLVILLFGNLYPAYASYKAVRTKNFKEYVKWMMYWIIFALFTCGETFTDVFLSWFPFYYEIKIVLVIWLLSPATKGSSFLYRKFVHPMLTKREQEIDEYLSRAKEQSYHTMLHLGTKSMTYATNVIMQTAIKGGGGIVNHLRRSYSLCDLSTNSDILSDVNRNKSSPIESDDTVDDANFVRDQRTTRSMRKLAAAAAGSHLEMYFPEVDVNIRSHPSRESSVPLGQIRSTDDISSGYSSADPVYAAEMAGDGLTRTSSVGGARGRTRGASRTASMKRGLTTTEDSDLLEDFEEQPSSPSWISVTPSIPFYPSLPPACISHPPNVNDRIFQAMQNQFILYKAYQDASCIENNPLYQNLGNFDNNNPNLFLQNFNSSNVNLVELINNESVSYDKPDSKIEDTNSGNKISVISAGDTDTNGVKSETIMNQKNQPSRDEFHDSVSELETLPENSSISLNNVDQGNDKEKLSLSSNDDHLNSELLSNEVKMIESNENNEVINEAGVKTPVRKSRKKKPAPLPPNPLKNDLNKDESFEIDDFQDAESDVTDYVLDSSSCIETDDLKENSLKDFDVNMSTINNIESGDDAKELTEIDKLKCDDCKNSESQSRSVTPELRKRNNSPKSSSTTSLSLHDGKSSKQKNPSKFAKFLPKSSNVSFLGFLHNKETHSNTEGTPSPVLSEEKCSTSSPSDEGIYIPLSGTDNEDKEKPDKIEEQDIKNEEIIRIREMSQSPTAKRKHQ